MIHRTIDINRLIPIEGFLEMKILRNCLNLGTNSGRIPVIPYSGQYLTCDGHHRTTAKLILNKTKIAVGIIEFDQDISPALSGVFTHGSYASIESVIGDYEEFWKHLLKKRGIASFQDYLQIYAKTITKINSAWNAS
jgi:hypothetical protein